MLRHPALHFLAIGAALFAFESWRAGAGAAPPEVVVRGATVAELHRTFAMQHGRPPGAAEERSLVDRVIDEEVFHREALARGLDRDDPVVRQRLLNVMEFVAEGASEERRLARATELGIDRKDVVVRRHLVQSMRLLAAKAARPSPPTDADLRGVLERHRDELALPTARSLRHVFVSRDKRGTALERDAARILGELRHGRVAPERSAALGDAFLLGAHFTRASHADLARVFGAEAAKQFFALPVGEWSGPISSPYGLHLGYVEETNAARLPSFESLRSRLAAIFEREREEERIQAWLRSHRARYVVRVEKPSVVEVATRDRAPSGAFVLPPKRAELGD